MPHKDPSEVLLVKPAIESLCAREKDSLWPTDVLNDSNLIQSTQLRQKLLLKIEELSRVLPSPTMGATEAIAKGLIDPDVLVDVYDYLSAFLIADQHHRRIILYLPFELLPHREWSPRSPALRESCERFIQTYMMCWYELIKETDVRANFVDGNILEPELAPFGQPLVRKAAHLIPILLNKGYISQLTISRMEADAKSDVLKESIDDALAPLSPITEYELDTEENENEWLLRLPEEIQGELRKLNMREALDYSRDMPRARVAWERQDNEEKLITRYAKRISKVGLRDSKALPFVINLILSEENVLRRIAMRGVGLTIEMLVEEDSCRSREVATLFLDHLGSKSVPDDSRDELETVLARLVSLGAVTHSEITRFGFEVPDLNLQFSESSLLAYELLEFRSTIEVFKGREDISHLLCPIVIFFGSRLKGYAKRNADLDAAVFVRPGVSKKLRPRIRAFLKEVFSDKKIEGKVVEFWLKEEGKGLTIRNFADNDIFLADSTWVHLLLSSVWLGERSALEELYTKLLPSFLRSKGVTFNGYDICKLWLDEMEREVLMYRLMHKGYRRFFAPQGGIPPGAVRLEPESTFWDSGYRWLATRLFLSRVFLPQL